MSDMWLDVEDAPDENWQIMLNQPTGPAESGLHVLPWSCEVKPRLTKAQHDHLEAHFQSQHEPSTVVKRQLADTLGASLDKINNWFQNRRTKMKRDTKRVTGPVTLYSPQFDILEPMASTEQSFEAIMASTANRRYLAQEYFDRMRLQIATLDKPSPRSTFEMCQELESKYADFAGVPIHPSSSTSARQTTGHDADMTASSNNTSSSASRDAYASFTPDHVHQSSQYNDDTHRSGPASISPSLAGTSTSSHLDTARQDICKKQNPAIWSFKCSHPNCDRRFTRADKRNDHIRRVHERLPSSNRTHAFPTPPVSAVGIGSGNGSGSYDGGARSVVPSSEFGPVSATSSSQSAIPTYTAPDSPGARQHIADLQHQVNLKSLALQTLQSEYAALLQKLQRERVKSHTIEKKTDVTDQEINELTSKNEHLNEQVKALEAQLEESENKRESEHLIAASEREQWTQMLAFDRKLQIKRTEDHMEAGKGEALQPTVRVLDSSSATSSVSASSPYYEACISVNYPDSLSTGLTSTRTSHKVAEQGRRNRINEALKEMQSLILKPSKLTRSLTKDEDLKIVIATSPKADNEHENIETNSSTTSKESKEDAISKSTSSKVATVDLANEYIKRMQKDSAAQFAEAVKMKRENKELNRRLTGHSQASSDAVRDLQLRLDRLFHKIELRQNSSTVFPKPTSQLSQSGSSSSEDSPAEQFPRVNDETNSISEGENLAEFRPPRPRNRYSAKSGLRNHSRRCRSLSPRATNFAPLASDVLLIDARARSESPNYRLSRPPADCPINDVTSFDSAEGRRSYAEGQTQKDNPNFQPTSSSQKKRRRDGTENEEGGQREDERNESNTKRRKILAQEAHKRNARFPCIFHVGEPDQYPTHAKRYEYISNLLRHLKSHNFFVCSKCFTKFESCTSFEMHDQNPCAKSCSRKNCIKHLPRGVERQQTCDCITSPEQQWKEIFHLQYPSLPIPDVFEDLDMDMISTPIPHQDTVGFDFALPDISDPTLLHGFLDNAVEPSEENPNIALTNPIQVDQSILSELQVLRQTIQLLEHRINQPNERESDLEMVLGMVWQALVRSGSSETYPEAPLFKLVRRFACHILNTAGTTQVPVHTSVERSDGPANSTTTISADDWMNLFNDSAVAGSSQGLRSDSGYQT